MFQLSHEEISPLHWPSFNTGSKFQALSNHGATSCALHVMPHDIAQTMGPSISEENE